MSVVLTASRVIQRPAASAFVGREKEFAELQRRLNAAIAGDCQFAVVAGEPGIGKTRLLEELKNLATVRKIRVLYGRFVEQDRAFSYQGFCELIQDYFRSRDPASSVGRAPRLLRPRRRTSSRSSRCSPRSASCARRSSGDSRIAAPAEERKAEDRIQIFELLARTLTRIAGGKPLVLILENLHGAEISIEALQYIVRRLGPTPTLIVGSYRQTETDKRHPLIRMLDSFADDPRFVSITLGPFSPSEHRSLVESRRRGAEGLRRARRSGSATRRRATRSSRRSSSARSSSPAGSRRTTPAPGASRRRPRSRPTRCPATIQQAVEKRIERLPEELRDLLSIASVLGKTFDFAGPRDARGGREGPRRRRSTGSSARGSSRRSGSRAATG